MKTKDLKAPYLTYLHIRRLANDFLDKYNSDNIIPVPIEDIVEFKLNITVIPCEDLQEKIEAEGYISCNLKEIYIDKWNYDNRETRTRFTIAHEIGHAVLHKDLYNIAKFKSIEEWKNFINDIPAQQYEYLESHANNFAGLVLVPSNSLQMRFEEAVKLLEKSGFDPNNLNPSGVTIDYLSNWIARKFNVSPRVIKIRIEKEGLLT